MPEIRNGLRGGRRQIEYSISSIGGKDLNITKENEQGGGELSPTTRRSSSLAPVYLLIKYEGRSKK